MWIQLCPTSGDASEWRFVNSIIVLQVYYCEWFLASDLQKSHGTVIFFISLSDDKRKLAFEIMNNSGVTLV